jgi:DNA repair protein RadA/Sms
MHDVYLNVAGGFRINEPAVDLAVAAALVSSLADVPIPAKAVLFGEVSLSGLVRPVPQAPQRLKEAAKLGFTEAMLPEGAAEAGKQSGLKVTGMGRIADLVAAIAGGAPRAKQSRENR